MSALLAYYPEWLLIHGPAILPVLPLLVAAICAVLPNRSLAWWGAFLTTLVLVVTSLGLVLITFEGNLAEYEMGGWPGPVGITLNIDSLNAPLAFLISCIAALVTLYAKPATVAEVQPKKRAPFYAAFLIVLSGLLGMVVSGDAFNVFVFLEVSSISTYVLVAMGGSRDRRALSSAYNYLILGSIGATFFVIGVGFLYMETGTLNMAEMREILRALEGGSRVALVGFAFVVLGLGLKLAMFPLHTWLPGAYANSPTFVTAFLASTATKAALYLLLRFTFTVFDPGFDYVATVITYLLTGVAVVAMIWCSVQAIFQTDARRVLAYSSVAQVGYILLGVGLGTVAGLAAGYIHLFNHAIIKGGLFVCMGAMWYRFGITRVSDFNGLAKLMPWTMAAFTISALSLIGVPLTAGFVSKINLASAAADRGWWWAVAVIVVASVLAILYLGRILLAAYFGARPQIDGADVRAVEAPLAMQIPMWALALSSIVIGINSDSLVEVCLRAAQVLLPLGAVVGGLS